MAASLGLVLLSVAYVKAGCQVAEAAPQLFGPALEGGSENSGASASTCGDPAAYVTAALVSWGVAGVAVGAGITMMIVGWYRTKQALKHGLRRGVTAPFIAPTHGGLVAGLHVISF